MTIKGLGGGGNTVVGRVSIGQLREPGDVLVTKTTNPSMMKDMMQAVAVVTDTGGVVCHGAIVCRELGVPFVVGTKNATHFLKDDQYVTVDPEAGEVEILDDGN